MGGTYGSAVYYVGNEGGQNSGDVHQLGVDNKGNWMDHDLYMSVIQGSPKPATPTELASFYADGDRPILVFYKSYDEDDLHVLEGPGGGWEDKDLTVATNGPHVSDMALTSFHASGYSAPLHVYYIDNLGDYHVHEAYDYPDDNHWWGNHPTSRTNSPGATGNVLTSLWIP